MELCIECKERPIVNKKRQLCRRCYHKLRNEVGPFLKSEDYYSTIPLKPRSEKSHQNFREIEFIKNYFTHNNFIYSPAVFKLKGTTYTPDFYDAKTNTFIEVSGTRQAYSANKDKYQKFRDLYPKLNYEIRNSDGEIIDESKPINSQI